MRPWHTRLRIWIARNVGPAFWPAWYVAPQWKLDHWHKIACELDPQECQTCRRYYGLDDEERERNAARSLLP